MSPEQIKLAIAGMLIRFTDETTARLKRFSDPRREPKSEFDASLAISEIRESLPRLRAEFTEITGIGLPLIGK